MTRLDTYRNSMTHEELQRFIIVIDHLPSPLLNPNNLRRTHWTVRHKETEVAKNEIRWLLKANGVSGKPMPRARISYEFHLKNRRIRDLDNLLSACKAYQDGLVEAGVLLGDDAEHLEIGSIKTVMTGHEETIITVEALDQP